MGLPRTATLCSVQLPELALNLETVFEVDASRQYVFENTAHTPLAHNGLHRDTPSRGHFASRSLNELLQRSVEKLLSTLRALEDALGNEGDTQTSQSNAFSASQAATLPPPNFVSITSAFAVLKQRLSGGRIEGSHSLQRRGRRKARKEGRCKHCLEHKELSSPFLSREGPCTCTTSIAFLSTTSNRADYISEQKVTRPTWEQLIAHPTAAIAFIPQDTSLFIAGALAGAAAKTITAPLDRLKLFLQVQDVNRKAGVAALTLSQAASKIFKEEGVMGFWKGNVPQVVRILPYSAVQLFSYEFFKKFFQGKSDDLSVPGRLAAGACAGMISTLITFPLDTLRFKMAIEPEMSTMSQAAVTLFRNEGAAGFYRGLGPGLLGIAPYIAINFCAYDLVRKAFPEKQQKSPQVTFATAVIATSLATLTCYPLDTIRRQMQVTGCQYTSVFDAFPAIIGKFGVLGLYRGFFINALKNLPTSSIRLTTYQTAKEVIAKSHEEWKALVAERQRV